MFRIRNTTTRTQARAIAAARTQRCRGWVLFVSLATGVGSMTGCAAMQNAANNDQSSQTKSEKSATLSQPAVQSTAKSTLLSDGSIRHDTDNARVAQLWAAVEKARALDDAESADRYLQEALSISPQDGVLWSRAAEIKLTLLEPALAENYAAKSNVYSVNNPTLLHRNWLIIEHARELRGDLLGVRDAHKMVQKFQR